jgi:hypothetical protein
VGLLAGSLLVLFLAIVNVPPSEPQDFEPSLPAATRGRGNCSTAASVSAACRRVTSAGRLR